MKNITKLVICGSLFILSNLSFATGSDTDLLVHGFNDFAFNLYHQQASSDQNIVMSPYSLSSLLGILVPGTAGHTRTQLLNVLNIKKVKEMNNVPLIIENLTKTEAIKGDQKLLAANALWADKRFTYKDSFLKIIQQNKSIQFETVDFNHAPEVSRQTINQWVEKKTKNLIKDLLPKGSITEFTRLVLTNAIYFKGLWQLPFKSENTQQKPFTLPNQHVIQTMMMQHKDHFLYAENNFMQLLQLNYQNSNLAMAILLPRSNHSLKEISKMMNTKIFSELVETANIKEIEVSIPKFKFESTFNSLNDSVKTLGLRDAFTQKANFSNLSAEPLLISNIIQKVVIQVDEKGTVAAASSAIQIVMTSYTEPLVFNANKPFMFIIFDTKSKIIFFIGQVNHPM